MLKDMTPVQIAVAVIGISGLIAWHELGHYLLARLLGMRVLKYAVGMGPKLWGFTRKGIEYQISVFPFGGFVQIFGMTPFEPGAIQDPRAFINRPRLHRILVLGAGPAFNYILAATLFFFFFWFFPGGTVHVLDVAPDTAAAEAGLLPGDVIEGIDAKPFRSQNHFLRKVQAGGALAVDVRREKATVLAVVDEQLAELAKIEADLPAAAPANPGADPAPGPDGADGGAEAVPEDPPPAEPPEGAEGPSDEVKAQVAAVAKERARLEKAKATATAMTAATERLALSVTPREVDGRHLLGIRFEFHHDAEVGSAPIGDVLVASVATCINQSIGTLQALGKLFSGDEDVSLEGPLKIGQAVTKAVERGARDLVWILASLSVALGLLNLLPVPALDGIKILVLLIESIRRKDLNHALQMWVNGLGLLFLLGLMLIMTAMEAWEMWGT